MISMLDLIGTVSAGLALVMILCFGQRRLSGSEKWTIAMVCAATALINGISFWSWSGLAAGAKLAENWGDYLQILQPALWGILFYVVVQNALQRKLEASRQQMKDLVENMPVILNAYDAQGRVLAWNRTAQEVTGYSTAEIRSDQQALSTLFPDTQSQERVLMECAHGGGNYQHQIHSLRGKDGVRQVAWFNISRRFPINGWANWCVGLDMTEQLAAQQQLEHLATHDGLTGLANRALLQDHLHHALANCQRKGTNGALLMLDLDHYKLVNDSHGHPVGDQLLREVANRMQSCLKATDTLARIGGDEFMVLLDSINNSDEAAQVAERLLHVIANPPYSIFGNKIHTRASIGITLFPEDDIRQDELLKNVDLALYTAKQNGRNHFHFYSRKLHGQFRWQHKVSDELRSAIQSDQLQLHYQPQIALSGKQMEGVEALLRWPHFERGDLSPAVFVPIAEKTGLMPALGRWVVEHACRQAAQWQQQGKHFTTGINLSAIQLYQPNLVEFLSHTLQSLQLNPEYIDLEITESAVMRNADGAIAAMRQLRDQGFRISLDDFGTGYSSLNYLKKFPVSRIKIDQSFVQGMTSTPEDAAIVRHVIRLGHDLGLQVVAEGVETRQQWQQLEQEGCDFVQGYYCSRPMSADNLMFSMSRPLH